MEDAGDKDPNWKTWHCCKMLQKDIKAGGTGQTHGKIPDTLCL